MRYEADHKARTHKRILRNASRELRSKGLNGPGVASVMKASGLTVGGFYKHFQNRDHLLVEAIEEGLTDFGGKLFAAMKQAAPEERWKEIVKWYLSEEHCRHADTGCPLAALAPDIARSTPAIKKRIAGIMKERRRRLLEFMPGRSPAEKGRNFNVMFTAMAGAVSMARMMPRPTERRRILSSVRDHLLKSF